MLNILCNIYYCDRCAKPNKFQALTVKLIYMFEGDFVTLIAVLYELRDQ